MFLHLAGKIHTAVNHTAHFFPFWHLFYILIYIKVTFFLYIYQVKSSSHLNQSVPMAVVGIESTLYSYAMSNS